MAPAGTTQLCHRCLQQVPVRARRCPHCGDIQKRTRGMVLFLGALGLIIVTAIVGMGLYLSPPTVDTGNNPDAQKQTEPPKPVKKPPLD